MDPRKFNLHKWLIIDSQGSEVGINIELIKLYCNIKILDKFNGGEEGIRTLEGVTTLLP